MEGIPKDIILFNDVNTGPYLEFIGYKAYIDSRLEVFEKSVNKKEDILKEFYDLNNGSLSVKELQDKYNFDYWLCDKNHAPYNQIINYFDWKIVKENEQN